MPTVAWLTFRSLAVMRIYAPLNTEPVPLLQEIEVATFFQLPHFQIIGLPGQEVTEARERIRSAIEASGIEFPKRRVVLNLSPASIRKRGTGIDFSMALSILLTTIKKPPHIKIGAWGELGLDGKVKAAGQITRSLFAAWRGGLELFFLSEDEFPRAVKTLKWLSQSQGLSQDSPLLLSVRCLEDAWKLLSECSLDALREKALRAQKEQEEKEVQPSFEEPRSLSLLYPLSTSLERTLGMIVSGSHHSLFLGPKGVGKTQILEWLVALQPPLSIQCKVQQQFVSELAETVFSSHQEETSGIRRVSSQVRPAALIGSVSSSSIRPGEFSLAHGSLLLADEFLEWARDSRECLREPLERGKITLSRVQRRVELPAQFQFAATGNLCPCGGWPTEIPLPEAIAEDKTKRPPRCQCHYPVRQGYLARLSGPILDRIDVMCLMTGGGRYVGKVSDAVPQLGSLREKIFTTQERLIKCWGGLPGLLSGVIIETIFEKNSEWNSERMNQSLSTSLRSKHKIGRIALTLAAWDGGETPHASHFLEAGFLRPEVHLSAFRVG